MAQIHHRTCNICEALCGLLVEVEGREVLSIRGDPDNALSRGHICPKGIALKDIQDDPDRLRHPLKRVGAAWQEISFAQAFAEIGERTREVIKYDPQATGVYLGNPNAHSYSSWLNMAFLLNALKTRNKFTASTVDQIPHQVANLRMWGHSGMFPFPDLDRTQTLIVIGGNPMASNGSMWTVPDFRNRVRKLKSRHGQLIVIDPRRTETAKIADRHLFIHPATDVFLLIALAKAVIAQSPFRSPQHFVNGLGDVAAAIERFDTAECAAACGIQQADIDYLAERLTSGPAALYGRFGVSTQKNGTLNVWLISVINILAGQLDREGGWIFTVPAVDILATTPAGSIGKERSRVSGHPLVLGEYPSAALAEEIETPGAGQLKALFVVAGNPVLSTPNGQRLEKALPTLDLMVSVDMYRNATSRHAHYILPPTPPLERDHYGLLYHTVAARTTAMYSAPTLSAGSDTLHDWEILRGLAGAISRTPPQALSPREMLDELLQSGPYRLSLAQLEAAPSGIDLGPPKVGLLPARLHTDDRMVHCAVPEFLEELAILDVTSPVPPVGLLLIGRRHIRSNNSWLSNSRRLTKGPDRCTLMINPHDAATRGIADGQKVVVTSPSGAVVLDAEVTEDIISGTVSIPHGWGHGLPGVMLGVALERPGVSANDLTRSDAIDRLSGNAALSGSRVEVRASETPAPRSAC